MKLTTIKLNTEKVVTMDLYLFPNFREQEEFVKEYNKGKDKFILDNSDNKYPVITGKANEIFEFVIHLLNSDVYDRGLATQGEIISSLFESLECGCEEGSLMKYVQFGNVEVN